MLLTLAEKCRRRYKSGTIFMENSLLWVWFAIILQSDMALIVFLQEFCYFYHLVIFGCITLGLTKTGARFAIHLYVHARHVLRLVSERFSSLKLACWIYSTAN